MNSKQRRREKRRAIKMISLFNECFTEIEKKLEAGEVEQVLKDIKTYKADAKSILTH